MTPRWPIRIVACAALFAAACAGTSGQTPARTFKPDTINVIEPEGQPDRWTYGPSLLKVAKGTAVAIVNQGKEFHTVTADDPGRPFDISVDMGKTVTFTFDKVGTFAYHCGVHPQMTGVIQVCDGACG